MRGPIAVLVTLVLAGFAAPVPAHAYVRGHSERLVARSRRGDRVARSALVDEHMGLVRSVAGHYRDLGLPVEDLVQEGVIGLLAAIDDYDGGRGASFSTHAFWRVRAAIAHAVTLRGQLVRAPRPVLERRRLVRQAQHELRASGSEPTNGELAAATGLSLSDVAEALAPVDALSLDEPLREGGSLAATIADRTAQPDAEVVAAERSRAVVGALRRLRGRKRTIVRRHFGIGCRPETLVEIARDLRLSPERTRALKDAALRELASELGSAL